METKIKYQIGDEIVIQFGKKVETVEITQLTKWYITCGWKYEFHADTGKCTNNQWQIVGKTKKKKKAKPRGVKRSDQKLKGKHLRTKTTKQ